MNLDEFQVILVDSEYTPRNGDLPDVLCLVAKNLQTGQVWRVWRDECRARRTAPYPCDDGALIVAYNAMSELVTHLSLGWPLPQRTICLMAEYRVLSNRDFGKHSRVPAFGLVDALHRFNLTHLAPGDKGGWQQRCIRGDSFAAPEDRAGLLNYCEQDVNAGEVLWNVIRPRRGLAARHVQATRQLLRKLLVGRITFSPDREAGAGVIRFRGQGTLQPIIGRLELQGVQGLVAPTGFEPVFQP